MSRFMSGEEGKTSRLWRVLSFEALGVLVYFCVLVYLCIITIILCNSWLPFSTYLYLDFHLLSRRWLLHTGGSKMFEPLFHAGMNVFDHFFLQNVFFICMHLTKKIVWSTFFVFNPPKRDVFIRRGCLAGQISRIEGIPSIPEISSIRKSHWS